MSGEKMTASVSEHKTGKRPGTYLIEVKTKMKNEAYHLRVAGFFWLVKKSFLYSLKRGR